MQATVLLYNFQDEDRKKRIVGLLTALRLRVRLVAKEEYGRPVGCHAGVLEPAQLDGCGPAAGDSGAGNSDAGDPAGFDREEKELPGEMMIFVGLTGAQVDQVLAGFRRAGLARVDCKAVLTPTSQYWTAGALYEELKKEHEAFRAGR